MNLKIYSFGNNKTVDKYNGVGICPRTLKRQTNIVSICNVECAFEPRGVLYLLYSASCHRRCQWCVCVLSSPWWSGLAEP